MASFSFFGNVMSMASVQLAGAKRDALLLSFKDAKVGGGWWAESWEQAGRLGAGSGAVLTCRPQLSVVEYDPGTHDLKTLSLHYFEEPELRVGQAPPSRPSRCPPASRRPPPDAPPSVQDGFVQNVHTPRVRVDPDGRCAAMLIYGTRLVVLPFRRETLAEEHEGLMGEG